MPPWLKKSWAFTISYICSDSVGHILFTVNKNIGDHIILMTEVLAIQEAFVIIIQKQLVKIMVENDLFVAIKSINREISPPSQMRKLVEDIKILAQVVKNT